MADSFRIVLALLLLLVFILHCLATTDTCGANEQRNPMGVCQRTCNACRDCGPCLCKPGYIRTTLGDECVLEAECHRLHLNWMHAAKYENKKDKFFNCTS